MATGPEHYAEAERLLAIPVSTDPEDQGAVIALHLAALAHATLAAAAAAAAPVVRGPGYKAHDDAWHEVAGYPDPPSPWDRPADD
jgi:hypothetical protein